MVDTDSRPPFRAPQGEDPQMTDDRKTGSFEARVGVAHRRLEGI